VSQGNDAGRDPWSAARVAENNERWVDKADRDPDRDGGGDGDGELIAGLVGRARAGDGAAVASVVERCGPMVRAVARRYVSGAEVDDVTQEVWLAFVVHMHQIEVPAATRAWLVRVTTRAAWRARRKQDRSVPIGQTDDLVAAPDDTEERGLRQVDVGTATPHLQAALMDLRPEDRRLVLLLSEQDRPDYRTISRLVDRPVGSIGPTRQRALERLRRQPELARSWLAAS
jgi:RNA polymerase sigma factor (sigma-70 family)